MPRGADGDRSWAPGTTRELGGVWPPSVFFQQQHTSHPAPWSNAWTLSPERSHIFQLNQRLRASATSSRWAWRSRLSYLEEMYDWIDRSNPRKSNGIGRGTRESTCKRARSLMVPRAARPRSPPAAPAVSGQTSSRHSSVIRHPKIEKKRCCGALAVTGETSTSRFIARRVSGRKARPACGRTRAISSRARRTARRASPAARRSGTCAACSASAPCTAGSCRALAPASG